MKQRIIKVDSSETTSVIFGSYDINARLIEERFGVTVRNRSGEDGTDAIAVSGEDAEAVSGAARTLEYLRDKEFSTSRVPFMKDYFPEVDLRKI